MLAGVEGQGLRNRQRFVGQGVQVGVAFAGVEGQDVGAGLARVADP